MAIRHALTSALAAALVLSTVAASANERHFTYTYETGTLPRGGIELEPWVTARLGREKYFARFDHRLEFEYGILDNLQAAVYVNFTGQASDAGAGTLASSFDYEGVSLELKYKLMDPVADPVGLALYFEFTALPHEIEGELKVLLDKRMGRFLFAMNAVAELEGKYIEGGFEVAEVKAEVDLGFAFLVNKVFSIGLEIRNVTTFEKEKGELEFESSAFFVGPTIGVKSEKWWLALSVLPQVFAVTESGKKSLDLEGHENVETRLLLGFHI